ncbi:MAG: apolipoprotein N-acyltransferase [Ignavibacteriaceae bacterium]|nr:apolipoprotein N-acyltransferase [Ignavibacteriaceae bacterium]
MRINRLNKDRLLLIASGILMGISFPPFPFPFQILMFIGLVPYFLVLERRERLIDLNRASYLMGFFFSLITLYWVGSWQKEADTFLMISGGLLIFVEPVFFMIPTTLLYFSRDLFSKSKAIYLFPVFWITYEYLYMITDLSFPWLTLGSGLSPFNIFIQIADITGALGISMVIIYINIFITKAIQGRTLSPKGFRINLALAVGIFILIVSYGAYRLSTFKISEKKVKVGLIQPNLDPWEKWSNTNLNDLISNYLNLSRESVKEGAQVIFWPETALPVYLRDGGYNYAVDSIYNFLDKNKVSLISGMPDLIYYKTGSKMPEDVKYNKSGNYYYATYNSVLLFSPFVLNIERYGKSKLVPFGERVPFVNALPFLRDFIKWSVGISDWNVGEDTTVFSVPLVNKDTLKINSLVCYESIYPYYVTRFVNKGADLISVVTNDSWYGNSSGPYQHKEIAVLRAVENRRTVIRAANGGISCIIDPMGRILTESKMYTRTEITGNVFIQEDETFFSKYPLLLPVISSVLSLWVLGIFILKKLKIRLGL